MRPSNPYKSTGACNLDVRLHPLDLFYASRLLLAGHFGYSAADRAGLVERYGDDRIQSVLADAFMGNRFA